MLVAIAARKHDLAESKFVPSGRPPIVTRSRECIRACDHAVSVCGIERGVKKNCGEALIRDAELC
jgi:hypothetical protein